MGLWAEAVVRVHNPRHINIKSIVLDVLKDRDGQEIIVDSTYSKEEGVCVGIRTDCYLGNSFNSILMEIAKKLRQNNVGEFHIEMLRNWYNL